MKFPHGRLWRAEVGSPLSSLGISDKVPIFPRVPYWTQDMVNIRISQPRTDMTLSPGASPQLPFLLSRPQPSLLVKFHHHYRFSLPKVRSLRLQSPSLYLSASFSHLLSPASHNSPIMPPQCSLSFSLSLSILYNYYLLLRYSS